MIIRRLPDGWNVRKAHITLQTDAERALSDYDLYRIVDNMQGVRYVDNGSSERQYELTGEGFGPDRWFSALAQRDGDTALVTVYID